MIVVEHILAGITGIGVGVIILGVCLLIRGLSSRKRGGK